MRLFGLIGRSLGHSFSQRFFTNKFLSEGITNCRYRNFELQTVDDLPELINNNPQLEGFNITIPYKEEVLPFLDELHPSVEEIGACNCVKIQNKKLLGFNTDFIGFTQSIQPFLRPHHKAALILGSGGASKAVQYALKGLKIPFSIVSRSGNAGLNYQNLSPEILKEHTLIINTTPVGTFPQIADCPQIPYAGITAQHLLYDLVYNPEITEFLKRGAEQGATICNGYAMLELQALESWRIWNSNESGG